MNLVNYFQQNVRITCIDGEEITGFVETFTPAKDSEEGKDEIGLIKDDSHVLIGISIDEISHIEVLN